MGFLSWALPFFKNAVERRDIALKDYYRQAL